jgi:uncharacterized protein YegP (UPF0339 family)
MFQREEENILAEDDDVARRLGHFHLVHQSDGRFHWELVNPRGTPTARSMEDYATEAEAADGAEQARRLIAGAPISRS